VAGSKRLVVVGYGMGAHHSRLIAAVEGLELYGVCDVDPVKREKAAQEYPAARLYASYEDVLADPEADCVVLVTPHNTHAPLSIAAMDRGKHVVTDKAICLTVAEAEAMIAARDRNGVLLSTFHNRRWDSDFVTTRKVVEEGLLGKLYHIQSCVTYYGSIGGWRTNREAMGGWLFDWGAHTVDQILILAQSRAKTVYAFAHHRYDAPTEVEDFIQCTLTFESGLTAMTSIGYINRLPMPRWYVMGETGTLVGDDFEKPLRIKAELKGITTELSVPLIKTEWKIYYQNLADHWAGKAELEVKPEQLVPQIAIAEAAYRSIAEGQVVRLG
jgi:scyllo-inositol 2-dehydrogenase (NADP+)